MYKMQRLEVSGAVRPLYGSLGVKGLNTVYYRCIIHTVHYITVTNVMYHVDSSTRFLRVSTVRYFTL